MLAQHSFTDSPIFSIDTKIGELVLNFNNKTVYTKTLNSDFIPVGNTVRKLAYFPEYTAGVEPSKHNTVLLEFKNINNELNLTTTYPFLSINNFNNTEFIPSTFNTQGYLAISDNLKLINKAEPTFYLQDLGDVRQLTLNSNFDKCVLTTNKETKVSTKDPFVQEYKYTWELRIEGRKLFEFIDMKLNGSPTVNQLIRVIPQRDRQGIEVAENTRVQIWYDVAPKLSNSLNADGYSIFNQIYPVQIINANTPLTTIQLNCNRYNVFVINCANVNILSFVFNYLIETYNKWLPISILIKNFKGALTFSNDVEFENGVPPILLGDTHILNCLLYNTGSYTKIRVLQKATNISKVPL